MCTKCGCHEGNDTSVHTHADGTIHAHADHHAGTKHRHSRTIQVGQNVLAQNDLNAAQNRQWLAARGVIAVNLISSPGSGKTYLLEKTLDLLHGRLPCAVITGDQKTDNDARRLAGKGAPVHQIETGSACHLDAAMVADALNHVVTPTTRLLFIENIGNLVCPAAFDLGEHHKIALLSTTEGEDKPLKYPALFSAAELVLLTKVDLIPHIDWDVQQCREAIEQVHPGVSVLELSARSGYGLDRWVDYLVKLATSAKQ